MIATDDVWEIEVKSAGRKMTNTVMKTMTTFRGNRVSDISFETRNLQKGPSATAGGGGGSD